MIDKYFVLFCADKSPKDTISILSDELNVFGRRVKQARHRFGVIDMVSSINSSGGGWRMCISNETGIRYHTKILLFIDSL